MKIVKQSVSLVWVTPDAEKIIESSGRKAYKSESKITATSHAPFIKGIIARGHESVLEHASASFDFVTDRAIANELVRHRLASFVQESTRYCNYANNELTFVEQPGVSSMFLETLWHQSDHSYRNMLSSGYKPEDARAALPLSLKTELRMTANFREWRHVIALRCDKAAHPMIRVLIGDVLKTLNAKAPSVFGDLAEKYLN